MWWNFASENMMVLGAGTYVSYWRQNPGLKIIRVQTRGFFLPFHSLEQLYEIRDYLDSGKLTP